MKKLNRETASQYWRERHELHRDDLGAVCYDGAPCFFSEFVDRFEKFAVLRMFNAIQFDFQGKHILDLGCGRGRWLDFYKSRGCDAPEGIDISPIAIQVCRDKGHRATEGSLTELPFPDSSFDLVSSYIVLLHLTPEDQFKASREIKRVLKKEGILVMLECTWDDPTPHVFGRELSSWLELFGGKTVYLEAQHFHRAIKTLRFLESKVRGLGRLRPVTERVAVALDSVLEPRAMRRFEATPLPNAKGHLMVVKPNEQEPGKVGAGQLNQS